MSVWEQIFLCLFILGCAALGGVTWALFRFRQADKDTAARCGGEEPDVVSFTYDDMLEYERAHDEMLANGWRLLHVTPRKPGEKTFTATFRRVK